MLINTLLMNKPTIHSKTLDEDIINLGAITMVIPDWVEYSVYKVSRAHIARPDLISQAVYGNDRYGDLLCKVNNIPNPFEINEGDVLVVPELSSLYRFLTKDTFNDSIDSEDDNKPQPKKKNEKRKANEAIVGDTRFKVDKDNRVIIY